MVLGSDVPLEKDILVGKKEFQQTYFEFLEREGLQIRENVTGSTNNNVYTVPVNKIFYLFHMNVNASIDSPGAFSNPNGWRVLRAGADFGLCQISFLLIGAAVSNMLNPSIPIRFEQGDAFSFIAGNTTFTGMMFGIEVDKELVFRR